MIYGDDYETPDGTCVRDYVHVTDLSTAHIKVCSTLAAYQNNFAVIRALSLASFPQALEYMVAHNKSDRFNLGCGQGYSVKEIIEAARRVTGHPIPTQMEARYAPSSFVSLHMKSVDLVHSYAGALVMRLYLWPAQTRQRRCSAGSVNTAPSRILCGLHGISIRSTERGWQRITDCAQHCAKRDMGHIN